ncbi:MAG: cytochrome c-550 PedF [Burkholderiales bacterium]|jgi:cytochrome c-550 PedF|nr:cytochrome c-550 PedF [Burkholderiales bacterium]
MNRRRLVTVTSAAALGALVTFVPVVHGHGDVTPQVVDTSELAALGDTWRDANPYRGNAKAVAVGKSGYNQNCARCHGLEAVSGGIAPDLRRLPLDAETDEYFLQSVRNGKVRNGAVYMPPFEGVLNQEAIWAIRSYLDTRHTDE